MKNTHSRSSLPRRIGWALLLPLAALAMAGCFRVELAFLMNDDGSGVVQYTFAISDSMQGFMDIEDQISVADEDLPPGAESREYTEEGYAGFVITMPFSDYAEFRPMLAQWNQEGEVGIDLPDISQDENGDWRFSMLLPPPSEGGGAEELGIPDEILADAWFRVRAKLPGELAEHNADRIENGEMVWQMDLESTEARQLTARSVTGGGSAAAVIGATAGAVLLIVVAVAIVFYVRRSAAGRAMG